MSSYRNYSTREGGRHHTDPTSSRFNNRSKYHQRGRGTARPLPSRRPTVGNDLESITVSIGRNLTTDGSNPRGSSTRGRSGNGFYNRPQAIHPLSRGNDRDDNQTKWWRVSIPQAGTIGKDRVMSTLKVHCARQFQPYHYFIDNDTNTGVFFVNNQQDADMLRRANRKVELQNSGTLGIMVSQASCPAPFLDEDLRQHFRDYLCNRRFNPQTFQLVLSNLADDEELSALGIFPQLNKSAFVRHIVDIINADLSMTRQLDLGSNNIASLYEFRNLHLNNLQQLSLASNQIKNLEELSHLKQLVNLHHILLKDNPLTSSNNRRNGSRDDINRSIYLSLEIEQSRDRGELIRIIEIVRSEWCECVLRSATIPPSKGCISYHSSTIRQKLPQLKRIDEIELPAQIGFAIDNERVVLPPSAPFCVPVDMQAFLAKFIDEYYRLFDTRGRGELHACYHDSCMFSLCVAPTEGSIVPTRSYKYGALIYDSRNLKRIFDDNKRATLLRHGKTDVLDFLRIKFPLTKHDGKSFHVDVLSTANNRAIFTVNGLYREMDQGTNGPVRSFQRTFTCLQTASGVLIIADHIMIINATDTQVTNMTRSAPPTTSGQASSSQTMESQQVSSGSTSDVQNQMIQKFSQQSGMNIDFSKLCLAENDWNYDKAAQKFQECQKIGVIPPEAFLKV